MTINPATVGTNAYDLLDGSISSFYATVDEAIVASEVVKGQYRMTINPAYNAPNPVDSNSFTTVGLTQSGPMVVDLQNSYITTEADITINLSKAVTASGSSAATHGCFFIGWKVWGLVIRGLPFSDGKLAYILRWYNLCGLLCSIGRNKKSMPC